MAKTQEVPTEKPRKKRTVRKREYVVQQLQSVKILGEPADAWVDVIRGCENTKDATEKIVNSELSGKLQIVCVHEQAEAKVETVKRTVLSNGSATA